MGIAIPYLLEDSGLFKVIHGVDVTFVEDSKGKSYKTHYSKTNVYNVAPSYMKGHGRSYSKSKAEKEISSFDYHIFTKVSGSSLVCSVLKSPEVLKSIEGCGIVKIVS